MDDAIARLRKADKSSREKKVAALHGVRRALKTALAAEEDVAESLAAYGEVAGAWAARDGDDVVEVVAVRSLAWLAAKGAPPRHVAASAAAVVAGVARAAARPSPGALAALAAEAASCESLLLGAYRGAQAAAGDGAATRAGAFDALVALPTAGDGKQLRKARADAWVAALARPGALGSGALAAKVLAHVADDVLATLGDPLRLGDFYLAAFKDDDTAIYALKGVFRLVAHHRLEAPRFFERLFALVTPAILAAHPDLLADVLGPCLASKRVPEKHRAAFVKKLATAALAAPPRAAARALGAIRDAANACETCRALLDDDGAADPGDDGEAAPRLHELAAFATHYAPTVAALAAACASSDPADDAPRGLAADYDALAAAAPAFAPPPPTSATAAAVAKRKRPLFDRDDSLLPGTKLRKLDAVFALESSE